MWSSKARITIPFAAISEIQQRELPPAAVETGGFLLTTFPNAFRGLEVNRRLIELGIQGPIAATSNVILCNYGLHIYSNIMALRSRVGLWGTGISWTLKENVDCRAEYDKVTCPVADDLFSRTQLLTIPSCLSRQDEDDIVAGFRIALG
jgi:8-amino-3,8-dideoxy-alpha-D-manno-octulosonate transaminase